MRDALLHKVLNEIHYACSYKDPGHSYAIFTFYDLERDDFDEADDITERDLDDIQAYVLDLNASGEFVKKPQYVQPVLSFNFTGILRKPEVIEVHFSIELTRIQ
jgi:hypothetical protein